jgi:hypothetical protein
VQGVDGEGAVAEADSLGLQVRLVVAPEAADLPPIAAAQQPPIPVVVGDRAAPVRVHRLLRLAGRVMEEAVALPAGSRACPSPSARLVSPGLRYLFLAPVRRLGSGPAGDPTQRPKAASRVCNGGMLLACVTPCRLPLANSTALHTADDGTLWLYGRWRLSWGL